MSYTLFPYDETNIFEFRNRFGQTLYFLYKRNDRGISDWLEYVQRGSIVEVRYHLGLSFSIWDGENFYPLSTFFSNYTKIEQGRGEVFLTYEERVGSNIYLSSQPTQDDYENGNVDWFRDIERDFVRDIRIDPIAFFNAPRLSATSISSDPRPNPNSPTEINIPTPILPQEEELENIPDSPSEIESQRVSSLDNLVYDFGDVRLSSPTLNAEGLTQQSFQAGSGIGGWVRETAIQTSAGQVSLRLLRIEYLVAQSGSQVELAYVQIFVPAENIFFDGNEYDFLPPNFIFELTHLATNQKFTSTSRSFGTIPFDWINRGASGWTFDITFGIFDIDLSLLNNTDRRWGLKFYTDLPNRTQIETPDLIYAVGRTSNQFINLFMSLEGQDNLAPMPVFEPGNDLLEVERQTRASRTYQIQADNFNVEDINIASEFGIEERVVEGNFLIPISPDLTGQINEYGNEIPNGRRKNIIAPDKIIRLGQEMRQLFFNGMEFLNWRSLVRQKITFRVENEDLPQLGDIISVDVDLDDEKLSALFPTRNKVGVVDGINYSEDYVDITIIV